MNTTDTLDGIFKLFRGIIFSSHTLQQKIQLLCHYQQGWLDQIRKGPILSTSTSLQPFCIFLIQLHVKLPPDQPGREMFASMAGAFLQLLQLKTSQFTDQWLSDYWPASSFAASTASTASTTPVSLDCQKREQTLQLVGTLLSVKCLAQPHLARRAYELCRPMLAAATMRPHTEHGRVAPHWNSSAVRMDSSTVHNEYFHHPRTRSRIANAFAVLHTSSFCKHARQQCRLGPRECRWKKCASLVGQRRNRGCHWYGGCH
jgi:hypothetical protein